MDGSFLFKLTSTDYLVSRRTYLLVSGSPAVMVVKSSEDGFSVEKMSDPVEDVLPGFF